MSIYSKPYDESIISMIASGPFKARAMADYFEKLLNNSTHISQLFLDVIDDPDAYILDGQLNIEHLQDVMDGMTDEYIDVQSYIYMDGGQIKISDVCNALAIELSNDGSSLAPEEVLVPVYAPSGAATSITIAFTDVGKKLADSQTNAAAMIAGLRAANVGGSVADKLSYFENYIRTSPFKDIPYFARKMYSEFLTSTASAVEYMQAVAEAMDVQGLLDAEDSEVVLEDNPPVVGFTGSTPMVALSTNSYKTKAGRFIAGGLRAAWNGVKRLGKKIVDFTVDKILLPVITSIVDLIANYQDPFDIRVINPSGNRTVDKFSWSTQSSGRIFYPWPSGTSGEKLPEDLQLATNLNTEMIIPMLNDQWLKVDTVFCEIMIKLSSLQSWYEGSNQYPTLRGSSEIRVKWKPIVATCGLNFLTKLLGDKVIDYQNYPYYTNDMFTNNVSKETFIEALTELLNSNFEAVRVPAANTDDNANYIEEDLWSGYYLSMMIFSLCVWYSITDNTTFNFSFVNVMLTNKNHITNAEWLQLLAGYDASNTSSPFWNSVPNTGSSVHNVLVNGNMLKSVFFNFTDIVLKYIGQEGVYPVDFPFFPYRAGKEGWSDPSFRIQSDSENQAMADKSFTAMTNIVLGAAAIIVVGLGARAVSTKIASRKLYRYNQLTAKMWDGTPLTNAEVRRYKRLTRQTAFASAASPDIVGAVMTDDDSAVLDSVGSVYDAIR